MKIKKVHGTVHGKSIEVAEDLGLPEGEKVELTIELDEDLDIFLKKGKSQWFHSPFKSTIA